MNDLQKESDRLRLALKATGISLALMALAYIAIYTLSLTSPVVYFVVPFVIAYWFSVVWLSTLAYGPVLGFVAFFSPLLPPVTFIIMLLAYSRASHFLKQQQLSLPTTGRSVISERREPTL